MTLRHIFGTGAIEAGVPFHIVQENLDHASPATTSIHMRYRYESINSLMREASASMRKGLVTTCIWGGRLPLPITTLSA